MITSHCDVVILLVNILTSLIRENKTSLLRIYYYEEKFKKNISMRTSILHAHIIILHAELIYFSFVADGRKILHDSE